MIFVFRKRLSCKGGIDDVSCIVIGVIDLCRFFGNLLGLLSFILFTQFSVVWRTALSGI